MKELRLHRKQLEEKMGERLKEATGAEDPVELDTAVIASTTAAGADATAAKPDRAAEGPQQPPTPAHG